jgi:NRPS condensation-like uncharacterized protein
MKPGPFGSRLADETRRQASPFGAAPAVPQRLPAPALDQLSFLFRSLSDGQVRCVLRMDGRVDAERLERAFRLSLDAEPVLGCRFVRRDGRLTWERREDLDLLPLLRTVDCAAPQALDYELQRFLVAPMNPAVGPVATARLLRADTDTLVIKLHHLAADGLGMLQFLIVFAAIYRQLRDNPGYQPSPNLGDRGQGQVLRRFGPAGMLAALWQIHLPVRSAGWEPIARVSDQSGRAFALRRLDPERVRALRAWGRTHGVSVNDLLLAAFYRALLATLGAPAGRPLRVGVPIDLRRYLASGQTLPVCNLSNSADLVIACEARSSFAETLRRVHTEMAALKSTARGLALAVLAELLAGPRLGLVRQLAEQLVWRIAPTGSAAPFFSNVGIIDGRLLDFDELTVVDAYGLGPVSFPPGLLVTVSTFREVMTIAAGFCDTATDRQLVERLLDRLACELPS